jgi:phosphoserine/homoserine phosphotransferase
VLALRELGFRTVAAGDSHNDLGMLAAAHAGFLVDPPVAVAAPGQPLAAPT